MNNHLNITLYRYSWASFQKQKGETKAKIIFIYKERYRDHSIYYGTHVRRHEPLWEVEEERTFFFLYVW